MWKISVAEAKDIEEAEVDLKVESGARTKVEAVAKLMESIRPTLAPINMQITSKLMPDAETDVSTSADGIIWLRGVIKGIDPKKTWKGSTKVMIGEVNCIALHCEGFSAGDEMLVPSGANDGSFFPQAYYNMSTRKLYLPEEIFFTHDIKDSGVDNRIMISSALMSLYIAFRLQSFALVVFFLLALAGVYFWVPKLMRRYYERKVKEAITNKFMAELDRRGIPYEFGLGL
jgi:hypothetical protein